MYGIEEMARLKKFALAIVTKEVPQVLSFEKRRLRGDEGEADIQIEALRGAGEEGKGGTGEERRSGQFMSLI